MGESFHPSTDTRVPHHCSPFKTLRVLATDEKRHVCGLRQNLASALALVVWFVFSVMTMAFFETVASIDSTCKLFLSILVTSEY